MNKTTTSNFHNKSKQLPPIKTEKPDPSIIKLSDEKKYIALSRQDFNNSIIQKWGEIIINKLPIRRTNHVSFIYDNYFYIFGGRDINETKMNDMYRVKLDFSEESNEKWEKINYEGEIIPNCVSGHKGLLIGNLLYIFGGVNITEQANNKVYIFNIDDRRWEEREFSESEVLPLSSHSMSLVGNLIVVVGGYSKGQFNEKTFLYDYENNIWDYYPKDKYEDEKEEENQDELIELKNKIINENLQNENINDELVISDDLVNLHNEEDNKEENKEKEKEENKEEKEEENKEEKEEENKEEEKKEENKEEEKEEEKKEEEIKDIEEKKEEEKKEKNEKEENKEEEKEEEKKEEEIKDIEEKKEEPKPKRDNIIHKTNKINFSKKIKNKVPRPDELPEPRINQSQVTVSDTLLYIYGGINSEGHYLDDMWSFCITDYLWTKIEIKGEIPKARSGHSCLIQDNFLYIFGGKTANIFEVNEFWKFDIENSKFILIHDTLLEMGNNEGKIYNKPKEKNVEYHDPFHTFYKLKKMNMPNKTTNDFYNNNKNGVHQNKYEDLVMKDHKAKIMKNSLIYRIEQDDQIFIKKLSQANHDIKLDKIRFGIVPVPRDGHSCFIHDNKMYVFGGDRNKFPFNDMFVYDFNRDNQQKENVDDNNTDKESRNKIIDDKKSQISSKSNKSKGSKIHKKNK